MVKVLGYPGYWLASEIAKGLNAKLLGVHEKIFPDGEVYVRIDNVDEVRNDDIVLVSTLYPKQEEKLFKTLLLVDAVKNSGARRVIAVIPYLAYSRQDKVFLPGEPISASIVVKCLKISGVDILVTIDLHSPRIMEYFDSTIVNILVSDKLVEQALKYTEKPVIIAPDKGAIERAQVAAKIHGLEYDYLVKHRDRVTGEVVYTPRELNINDRDVIVVDDIISTGGTIAESSKKLYEMGVRSIIVAASHGLLVGEAINKLEASGVKKIILADTLEIKHQHPLVEYVNVVDKILLELRKLLGA